jgi:hypothetical protein
MKKKRPGCGGRGAKKELNMDETTLTASPNASGIEPHRVSWLGQYRLKLEAH